MYENYINELLSHYLNKEQFERLLPLQNGGQITDFILFVDGVTVLVESKATLIYLQAKQQVSDTELIDKYMEDTIKKAVAQLQETEKKLVNGDLTLEIKNKSVQKNHIIKIVLLYENLRDTGLIQDVYLKVDNSIDRVYIASIEDFELFLDLYMREKEKANAILVNLTKSQEKSTLRTELEKASASELNYQCSFTMGKFNYLGSFMEKLKTELR